MERFQFPRTGYKGSIKTHPSANFVLVSFSPNCVHVLSSDILSIVVTVLRLKGRIQKFEISEYEAGKFAVWLLSGEQVFVCSLSASGAPLNDDTSMEVDEVLRNSKKRPHSAEEELLASKKARSSPSIDSNEKPHILARQTHSIDLMPLSALPSISSIISSSLGLIIQHTSSKEYHLLSPNGEQAPFISGEGLQSEDQITATYALSASQAPNTTLVPLSLLTALIGSQSPALDSTVILASTSKGSVLILSRIGAHSGPYQIERSLPTRLDSAPLLIEYVTLPDSTQVLVLINKSGQVSVLREADSSFAIRRFSLSRTISSVCRVGHRFAFCSDGSTFMFSIDRTASEILLTAPRSIISSPSALCLAPSTSQHVLVLDSSCSLAKCSLDDVSSSIESGSTGQKISKALQLLTRNLDQQDALKTEEAQIDTLTQQINLAIHAGARKSQFVLRISPKIETDSSTFILSLVVPSYLRSLALWSIALSVKQGSQHSSFSIPLEDFQAPKTSKAKSSIPALQYRLRLASHSLHPLTISSYLVFHISSLLPRKHERKGDEPMLLTTSDDSEYATFPLGDFKFDALQLMARSKNEVGINAKMISSNFRSRLRHILTLGNRTSLTVATPSSRTFEFSMSIWTFPSWLELSEEKITSLMGSSFKSLPTNLKNGEPTSSGTTTHLETAIGGAFSTIVFSTSPSDPQRRAASPLSLEKGRNGHHSAHTKHIACRISLTAQNRAEEVRASIVHRLASIAPSSKLPAKEDTNMARELTESLQDPWRQVMRLEARFFELEQELVRFLEYKQWRQSNQGFPRVLKTASYLHEYVGAQSQEKRAPDVPRFEAVNEESTALASDILALYRQVRNLLEEKYAF